MTLDVVPFRGYSVPVLNGKSEISRYTTADYISWLSDWNRYMGPPTPVTTYGSRPAEPISNSFQGFVEGMLYADGPVAAAEAYRLRVFGQAPLLYQEINDGRAGDMFDDEALDRLREPWAGGTLGDLMKRTLVYGDFAGNGFILDLEDELVLVRPDWVEIILAKRGHRGGQVGWRQVGIMYYEGGLRTNDGVPFLPGEYAHFVPGLPDPLATYRGMSWLTPLIREVQADKAASDHKLAFFENAASPNLAVSLPKEVTKDQFDAFVDAMEAKHRGTHNAYRTLYTGGGADVTVIGANMQQMDFSAVQGKGEPLALDTPIPTPTGWTTMGEIQVGDYVIGSNGEPALVLGVSPVHADRDCYRVTLKDKTSIVADASHIWAATDRFTRRREMKTYTTRDMLERIQENRPNGVGGHRFAVPAAPIVELPEADLLVDPYVLGAWLGDGQTAGAAICGATDDLKFIANEIESRGYVTTSWVTAENKVDVIGIPGGLTAALRALGVLGNKAIPQQYLRASVEQRLDLLRGLMDTDGHVDALGRGQCEFSSKFEHLTRQVAELLRSLGYRATISRKADARSRTGYAWLVRFRVAADRIPFILPRKVDRCILAGDQFYGNERSIVSIEPALSVPVRCIAVDTEDHLFLAGDGFVPTHNTRVANAAGVPPVLLSFSEGMQGSSLNAGNYTAAKRNFVDTTMRDLWQNFSGSVQQMDAFKPPRPKSRLWYLGRDIPFMHEDAKDLAEIQQTQASTISSLITSGFKPETCVPAVVQDDLMLLEHTGLTSVQLLPPGQEAGAPVEAAPEVVPEEPLVDFGALRDMFRAEFGDEDDVVRTLLGALDEIERRDFYDVRVPKGFEGGGRFRSLSDRLTALLSDWAKGEGPDDPLDQFDREQLRKTAKQLADKARAAGDNDRAARLTPRRGASAEEIKLALYTDVRGSAHKGRDARPPKVTKFTLRGGGRPDPAKVREVEVENRIRAAYTARPKAPGGWVGLAELRADLDDLSREDVDAALRRLVREKGVRPAPFDNTRALRPQDKAAALQLGDSPKHMIAFDGDAASPRVLPGSNRDRDVAVFQRKSGEISLREESDRGQRGDLVVEVPDLAALEVWARDNGEPEVAEWARKERGGPDVSPDTRVLDALAAAPPDRWGRPKEVALADLREQVGLSRQEFDNTLRRLAREGRVVLIPEEDRRRIKQRDRDAALRFGDDDNHGALLDPDEWEARKPTPKSEPLSADPSVREVQVDNRVPAPAKATKPAASLSSLRDLPDAEAVRDELDLRKVDELKAVLRDAGLPVSGRKRELVDRLVGHVKPDSKASPAATPKAAPTTPKAGTNYSAHSGRDVTDEEERDFLTYPPIKQAEILDRIRPPGPGGLRERRFGTVADSRLELSPERTAEIRHAIEEIAYREGGRTGDAQYVTMKSVREGLAGRFPRNEVDAVILHTNRTGDWQVTMEVNQKMLTPRDRLAAVIMGNQDKHVIAVRKRLTHVKPDDGAVSKPASARPTAADTPRMSAVRKRLAAIAEEARPIADEVAKRLESKKVYSHNEEMAYYKRLDRRKKLGEEGSKLASELLGGLIGRDGEPWGGDPDADANRWQDVPLGFGGFASRGTLDPDAVQKSRDRYVISDRNTIEQNASLRSGSPTPTAENWAKRMSKMVRSSELTADTKLYRGAAMQPDQVMQLRPGAVLHDRGIVSTGRTQDEADFYANTRLERMPGTIKTLFEIRASKGSSAIDVGYDEVVLDRDQRFRIVSSRIDGGVVRVVMELMA